MERLQAFDLTTLSERRQRGDMIQIKSYLLFNKVRREDTALNIIRKFQDTHNQQILFLENKLIFRIQCQMNKLTQKH